MLSTQLTPQKMKQILQSTYDEGSRALLVNNENSNLIEILKHANPGLLEILIIENCLIGIKESKQLRQLQLSRLKFLKFYQSYIPCNQDLLDHQWVCLQVLRMSGPQISDPKDIRYKRFGYKELRHLQKINFPSMKILIIDHHDLNGLIIERMPNLIKLNISKNPLGNRGLKLIIKSNFAKIQHVEMEQCNIGNEGANHLCKAYWPNLRILKTSNNTFYRQAYGLQKINCLNFPECKKILLSYSLKDILGNNSRKRNAKDLLAAILNHKASS